MEVFYKGVSYNEVRLNFKNIKFFIITCCKSVSANPVRGDCGGPEITIIYFFY